LRISDCGFGIAGRRRFQIRNPQFDLLQPLYWQYREAGGPLRIRRSVGTGGLGAAVFQSAEVILQVLCRGSNDRTGAVDLALLRRVVAESDVVITAAVRNQCDGCFRF
jgi:hypothetical protein